MNKYCNMFLMVILGITILTSCAVKARRSRAIIGRPAPSFTLLDEQGNRHSLAQYKGKKVALYFYPKSGTRYCTQQACSIRDSSLDLTKKNIIVLGVSYDSPEKNREFKYKNHLPFPLLSDTSHEVAKTYGAHRGLLFGSFAPERITFLIDENGILVDIIRNIDISNHANQIMEHFNQL